MIFVERERGRERLPTYRRSTLSSYPNLTYHCDGIMWKRKKIGAKNGARISSMSQDTLEGIRHLRIDS